MVRLLTVSERVAWVPSPLRTHLGAEMRAARSIGLRMRAFRIVRGPPLFAARAHADTCDSRHLVIDQVDPFTQAPGGKPHSLHAAAAAGDCSSVSDLLARGADRAAFDEARIPLALQLLPPSILCASLPFPAWRGAERKGCDPRSRSSWPRRLRPPPADGPPPARRLGLGSLCARGAAGKARPGHRRLGAHSSASPQGDAPLCHCCPLLST